MLVKMIAHQHTKVMGFTVLIDKYAKCYQILEEIDMDTLNKMIDMLLSKKIIDRDFCFISS